MFLVQILVGNRIVSQYKTTSKVEAECFVETYLQQVELDGGENLWTSDWSGCGVLVTKERFFISITNIDECTDVMDSKLMKEGE